MVVINPTTLIESGNNRFLIMDAPSNENAHQYLAVMKAQGVTDLVRTCELTYDEKPFKDAGIRCHELAFADGEPPPDSVLDEWLQLVDDAKKRDRTIAIHCVAGLGRAPVLVAVALIEKANFDTLDAIDYIRNQRKGAINRKQLQYLRGYRRRGKSQEKCCGIM